MALKRAPTTWSRWRVVVDLIMLRLIAAVGTAGVYGKDAAGAKMNGGWTVGPLCASPVAEPTLMDAQCREQ